MAKIKFTKKRAEIVKTAFENYNRLIIMEQEDYLDRFLTV